jgi:hypothetical protein
VGGETAFAGAAFLDRFYADSVTRFLDHDAAVGATHALATDASGLLAAVRSTAYQTCFIDDVAPAILHV